MEKGLYQYQRTHLEIHSTKAHSPISHRLSWIGGSRVQSLSKDFMMQFREVHSPEAVEAQSNRLPKVKKLSGIKYIKLYHKRLLLIMSIYTLRLSVQRWRIMDQRNKSDSSRLKSKCSTKTYLRRISSLKSISKVLFLTGIFKSHALLTPTNLKSLIKTNDQRY